MMDYLSESSPNCIKIAIYKIKFCVFILELRNNKKFIIYYLKNKECILQLFEFLLGIYHYPRLLQILNFFAKFFSNCSESLKPFF